MNPPIFSCTYVAHNQHPIIKFCLNEKCKEKKDKLCQICWNESHKDHQLDCFPITILYSILQIHLKKLEQLFQQHQSLSKKDQCDSFSQELIDYQDKFKKLIKNQLDEIHIYQDNQILIQFARQCYNNQLQKLLIAFLLNQPIGETAKSTIIQIIQHIYAFDDSEYLLLILTSQIEDLLQLCKYNLALQKINSALKFQLDYFFLAKKYSILIIMSKNQEANQLIYQDDYNNDTIFQGQVMQFVNYHYYKRQHINDDRFNMQLFQSLSLLDQGKIDEANNVIKAELYKKPESLDIVMFYVKFLALYQNKFEEAIHFCKQGMEKYPNCQAYSDAKFLCMLLSDPKQYYSNNLQNISDETKISYAIVLIRSGEFQKAIECLNSIQKHSKKYPEAQSFLFIAQKLFSKNKGGFSFQSMDQSRQQNSPLIQFIQELKNLCLEKKFQSALDLVEKKLFQIPNSLFLNLIKSICLIALKEYGRAEEYLNIARQQYPNEPIIEICYAYNLVGLKQYQQALEIIDNQPLQHGKSDYLELKGQIYFHQGLLDASLNCFKQLQSNQNKMSKIDIYLGLIHQVQKQYNVAINYYDRALQTETDKPQLLYNKALAILDYNIIQKVQPSDVSLEEAKNILQSIKGYSESQWLLVILNFYQNNFNEAHSLLEIIKNDTANSEKAQKLQANIYYKQRVFEKSVNLYQKLNFSSLNKIDILQYIISALLIKNFVLAESLINKSQHQLKSLFYFFKGFLMEFQGKYQESLQFYEEFCSQELSKQAVTECLNIVKAAKLAQRKIFIRLQQNQKVIEFENTIKKEYPNLPLDTNYQDLLISEFEQIHYRATPILSQLENINLILLMDFTKWCVLIDKHDSLNNYLFECIFKQ
ncbi:unnamed protein product [Paramecium octaurelia]|uniref:Tetratricopeptide repeat protein n=1 Tax=Paramecium octaurelia TaxID=43137 RepID=A0A8S1XZ09_PAROT|nr:unnamed protein product [Paramecium octaurelia]